MWYNDYREHCEGGIPLLQQHWHRFSTGALERTGRSTRNYRRNAALWQEHTALHGQGTAPLSRMRYAGHAFSWNGCGVLAVYHALRLCGCHRPLPALLWEFERNRMCWLLPTGTFGTNPAALRRPLAAMGVPFETTRQRETFLQKAAAGEYRCGIISYWNHRKSQHPLNFFGGGMHTVAFRFCDEGILLYNVGGMDTAPRRVKSLAAFLEDRRLVRGYLCNSIQPDEGITAPDQS